MPSAAQQACPARQVCGLTRDCFVQFVRRLTTKELVFLRFVAPQDARVNDKKRDMRIPGDGDQRFPNDRDRDSWMIVISVPTEGDQ